LLRCRLPVCFFNTDSFDVCHLGPSYRSGTRPAITPGRVGLRCGARQDRRAQDGQTDNKPGDAHGKRILPLISLQAPWLSLIGTPLAHLVPDSVRFPEMPTKAYRPITNFAILMLPASGTPTWISVSLSIACVAAVGWPFFGDKNENK
jgi:hypothetical protein